MQLSKWNLLLPTTAGQISNALCFCFFFKLILHTCRRAITRAATITHWMFFFSNSTTASWQPWGKKKREKSESVWTFYWMSCYLRDTLPHSKTLTSFCFVIFGFTSSFFDCPHTPPQCCMHKNNNYHKMKWFSSSNLSPDLIKTWYGVTLLNSHKTGLTKVTEIYHKTSLLHHIGKFVLFEFGLYMNKYLTFVCQRFGLSYHREV